LRDESINQNGETLRMCPLLINTGRARRKDPGSPVRRISPQIERPAPLPELDLDMEA
jgi:hypothetical protein